MIISGGAEARSRKRPSRLNNGVPWEQTAWGATGLRGWIHSESIASHFAREDARSSRSSIVQGVLRPVLGFGQDHALTRGQEVIHFSPQRQRDLLAAKVDRTGATAKEDQARELASGRVTRRLRIIRGSWRARKRVTEVETRLPFWISVMRP